MNMNMNILSVATVLVISSSANAALIGCDIIIGPRQHPDGLHDTWQVIIRFDNALDQISNVNGSTAPGLNQLVFATGDGSAMYNQALFAGLSLNDFPTSGPPLFGENYDSYVTIGATSFPSNIQFTSGFLGGVSGAQVILGGSFTESAGEWFFIGGTSPTVASLPDAESGNQTYDIVIAQFTIDAGVGFRLEGNIGWIDTSGGPMNTPFKCIPAPGAFALLGLAGLASIRRRHR